VGFAGGVSPFASSKIADSQAAGATGNTLYTATLEISIRAVSGTECLNESVVGRNNSDTFERQWRARSTENFVDVSIRCERAFVENAWRCHIKPPLIVLRIEQPERGHNRPLRPVQTRGERCAGVDHPLGQRFFHQYFFSHGT